jgi:hypothetical protein
MTFKILSDAPKDTKREKRIDPEVLKRATAILADNEIMSI